MDTTTLRWIAGGLTLLVMGVLAYLILEPYKSDLEMLWVVPPPVHTHQTYRPLVITPPSNWVRVDAGRYFHFFAPPGTVYKPLKGVDSFVGGIEGPGFKLAFDFGPYSNDLRGFARWPGHTEEKVFLSGRAASIRPSMYSR